MSYDNPINSTYWMDEMDFGAAAGATIHPVAGPKGMQGWLVEVGIVTTEATVFATTEAMVEVGTIADPDAYAQLNIATAVGDNTIFNTSDDVLAIIEADIPADTPVFIKLSEGTGAALAGKGRPYVMINWF